MQIRKLEREKLQCNEKVNRNEKKKKDSSSYSIHQTGIRSIALIKGKKALYA